MSKESISVQTAPGTVREESKWLKKTDQQSKLLKP